MYKNLDDPFFASHVVTPIFQYYDEEFLRDIVRRRKIGELPLIDKWTEEEYLSSITPEKTEYNRIVEKFTSFYVDCMVIRYHYLNGGRGQRVFYRDCFADRGWKEEHMQYEEARKQGNRDEKWRFRVNEILSEAKKYFRDQLPTWIRKYEKMVQDVFEEKKRKYRYEYWNKQCPKNYHIRQTMDEKGNLSDEDHSRWLLLLKGYAMEGYFPIGEDGRVPEATIWSFKRCPEEHKQLLKEIGIENFEKKCRIQNQLDFWKGRTEEDVRNSECSAQLRILNQYFMLEFFTLSVQRGLDLDVYEPILKRVKNTHDHFINSYDEDHDQFQRQHCDRTIRNIEHLYIPTAENKLSEKALTLINAKFPRVKVHFKTDYEPEKWQEILNGTAHNTKHHIMYSVKHNRFKILQPTGAYSFRWEDFTEANTYFGWIETDGYNTWVIYPSKDDISSRIRMKMMVEYIGEDPYNGRALKRLEEIRNRYERQGVIKSYVVCEHKVIGEETYWTNNDNIKKVTAKTKERCENLCGKRRREEDQLNKTFYPYEPRKNARII